MTTKFRDKLITQVRSNPQEESRWHRSGIDESTETAHIYVNAPRPCSRTPSSPLCFTNMALEALGTDGHISSMTRQAWYLYTGPLVRHQPRRSFPTDWHTINMKFCGSISITIQDDDYVYRGPLPIVFTATNCPRCSVQIRTVA